LSLTAAGWPTASDWDRPFGPRAGMAAIGQNQPDGEVTYSGRSMALSTQMVAV